MAELEPYLLQNSVPLPESILWELQRNYFKSKGITAWEKEVPFYISSNTFIAHQYAELVVNYIQDLLVLNPKYLKETFYLFELGAGTGKFSFYFLKSLFKILNDCNLSKVNFCYVITDIAKKNINFYQENPWFLQLIEQGKLDFSLFNLESDTDFYLQQQAINLSDLKPQTPLIIIGNYVLDCIQQDVFEIKDKQLYQVNFSLKSRYRKFDTQKCEQLNELRFHRENVAVDLAQFEPLVAKILNDYQDLEDGTNVLIPLGAFKLFKRIDALAEHGYCFIAGDKGISTKQYLNAINAEHIMSFDGCYAFVVNFHALGEFVKEAGGDYLPSLYGKDFQVNLYSSAYSWEQLPKTRTFFKHSIESFGPNEFCDLHQELEANAYHLDIKTLMSYLRMSYWDPDVFIVIQERIIELQYNITYKSHYDLLADIKKVEDNIYHYPNKVDIYNLFGIFYFIMRNTDVALAYHKKSLISCNKKDIPYHNLGIIYEKLEDKEQALMHYQLALEHNPKDSYVKERIDCLTEKWAARVLKPILKGLCVAIGLAVAFYCLLR